MRVLQVVGCMNMGGLETFVMNIFRNIDRTKVQFDFLYITNEKCFYDDEILELGGRIFRITGKSKNLIKHCHELKAFIEDNKDIDIVHIHSVSALCLLDAFIIKKCGINNIVVHSHASLAPHKALNEICKVILPWYSKKMIACSDKAAAWMFPKWKKDIEILPNGIDVTKYAYNDELSIINKKQLGIEGNFVVGHVGRMSPVKNHSFLLNIFAEIKKKKNNSVLLLIGDGQLKESLINQALHLGISESVLFLGIREDINTLLQTMDAFVFPSLREGLPLSVVEAQAAGVRCFISDTITRDVVITDIVQQISLNNGEEYWANTILRTCKEDELHKDTSEEIKAAGFDIKETTNKLITIYEMMIRDSQ